MKVSDNLENYDIPKGFHLTVEQEEELARIVKEIIPELDKRKTSKVETRKYFKQHLRYSSNVKDDNAAKGKKGDLYEEGESYSPLDGEYTWDSDILQPVLLQILLPEEVKYGYICNLLHEDMESRGKIEARFWAFISDRMVRFAQEFDFEEIRDRSRSIANVIERVSFLNKIKADYKLFDGLSKEQSGWIYEPFGEKLEVLITEAQSDLEIWKIQQEYLKDNDGLPFPRPLVNISVLTPENYELNEKAILDSLLPVFDVANDPALEVPSLEKLGKVHLIFKEEFYRFLEKMHMAGWQNANTVLSYIDNWTVRMRGLIDIAYYKCPCSEFVRRVNPGGDEKDEELSIDNLFFAEFALQELLVIVFDYKANLLFNNRDSEDVLYFLDEGGYDSVVERRKALSNSFGKLDQLKEISDPIVNIQVFFRKIARIIHAAIMEGINKCSNNNDQISLSQTLERLEKALQKWHVEYLEMLRHTEELITRPQLEERIWFEVTKFCFVDAFLKAEKRLLNSEALRHLCNIRSLLSFQFEGVDGILNRMIENMISKTGDEQYDEHNNDLGTINLDLVEKSIPPFPWALIDDKFVTFSEWKEACGIVEDDENEATVDKIIDEVYTAGRERDWNEVRRRLQEAGVPFAGKRFTEEDFVVDYDQVRDTIPNEQNKEEIVLGYQYKDLPAAFFTSLHALFVKHGIIEGVTKDELEEMFCQANVARIYKMPYMTKVRFVLIKLKGHFPEQWQKDVASNLNKEVNEIFRGYNVPSEFEGDYNKIIKTQ